jgi:hypothetical protein
MFSTLYFSMFLFKFVFVLFFFPFFVLNLDFCLFGSESYFESWKVNSWVFYRSRSLLFCVWELLWQFPWVQVVLVNVMWCNCVLFWLCVFNNPWGFKAQWDLNTLGCRVVWRERKTRVVLRTTPMRREPCEKKKHKKDQKEGPSPLSHVPPPNFPFFPFLSIIFSFIFKHIKSSYRWQQQ